MSDRLRLYFAVRENLTDDLLKPAFRALPNRKHATGHCYVASEAMYHLLGGRDSGLVPMTLHHEGSVHWFLRDVTGGRYIDPTSDQFDTAVPYYKATARGFLTRQPSMRAALLMHRVRETLEAEPRGA